ncbi:S8 family peptidase [Sphingomonas parva]|uniref:S8 family peptidase n=1 Tax=Sphingomonas parva TaxID=2555898 RepID=A0A4Y8ZY28_9SPHN|nr:S8 family peptidase [Sphingomonas parva]TFI59809.1 S8 family peptidase [Sphingomonas parva]
MPVERPHLIVESVGPRYDFSLRGGGGGTPSHPPVVANRTANASRVVRSVSGLVTAARRGDDPLIDPDRIPMTARAGTEWGISASVPGPRRNEVLSVVGFDRTARVNVALDPSSLEQFEAAAQRYRDFAPGKGRRRPHHFDFFEAQPTVEFTTVSDLWASKLPIPDMDDEAAWEVWLPPAAEPRLREVLETLGLRARRSVAFERMRVLALEAPRRELERVAKSAAIAQLRPASSLNSDLMAVPSGIQAAAVMAAARRIDAADDDAPAVCILDTGVMQNHPLLADSIRFADSVPGGDADDWHGHGTKMAGLALFDDLAGALQVRRGRITLPIGIESVTIDPAPGAVGVATLPAERLRQGVNLVEEENGDRLRTYCLAMNAPEETDDGGPSSLSCEIDTLASDVSGQRLFCVAAGNLDGALAHSDYQSLNEVTGMLTPSQAWNVLSVGACTDLVGVPATHRPLAPEGDLSPWSRTAVNWERRHRPPVKPDVVFEGGNQMVDRASSDVGHHPDLCLLTTAPDLNAPVTLTGQTSGATAAMAGLCARIQAEYPRLWPETVRALVVHGSDHTPAMIARANAAAARRGSQQQALLERFGFGRPDRAAVLENAEDALTMIMQGWLRPLRLNDDGKAAVLGQMRAHRLPWPEEVLEDLGQTEAELRITLSYFIEPNPAAVVRGDAEEYASHGFDFDVKRPDESEEQAIARLNDLRPARRPSSAAALPWMFGPRYRGRGGLKHDRLRTTAADLARMGGIIVFPRKGWWGDDVERIDQQARYSLVVTIRTPEEEIYTQIAAEIEAGIEV